MEGFNIKIRKLWFMVIRAVSGRQIIKLHAKFWIGIFKNTQKMLLHIVMMDIDLVFII